MGARRMKGERMKSYDSSSEQTEKAVSIKYEIINIKRNIALVVVPFIFLAIYYLLYVIFHKTWHLRKLDHIEYVVIGFSLLYIIFMLIKEKKGLGLDLFLSITFCIFVIISFFNSTLERFIYLKYLEILFQVILLIIPIVILVYYAGLTCQDNFLANLRWFFLSLPFCNMGPCCRQLTA